jgi:hypothetical protein
MTTGAFAFCAKGMVKLFNLVEVQKSLQKKSWVSCMPLAGAIEREVPDF